MGSLQNSIEIYRQEIAKGTISQAYRGIMDYMRALNISLQKEFPHNRAGSLYQGNMDMSFFTSTPVELLERKLKVAVVFLHESVSFELWLTAFNKGLQKTYWEEFKGKEWPAYLLQPSLKGKDAILEYQLIADPDFDDQNRITTEIIKKGLRQFSTDVISCLESPDKQA